MTTIKNVRVFNGNTLTTPTNVTFENGYISNIGTSVPSGAEVYDGQGLTLLPGYIDAHIHLNDIDNLKRAARCGITTMMDMQPTSVELANSLRELPGLTSITTCASIAVGPGGILPKVVIVRDEDIIRSSDPQEGINFVDRMVEKGAEYIKVILENPPATEKMLTVGQVRAIVGEAHKKNRLVFVHTTTELAWRTALEAGCDVMNHLPRHSVLPDDIVEAVAAGKHYVIPTLIMMKGLIDQKPDGSNGNFQNCLDSLRKLHEAGAIIIAGSDSNMTNKMNHVEHGKSFLTELELMVRAGMSPVEVLKSMGQTPAKYFPFLSDRGSIEVGKRADLVLVDGDPTQNISACRNIKKVWVKGIEAAN